MASILRAAVFLGFLVLTVLGVVTPAQAHDTLIASSPSDGEVLSELPAEIELEFSANILEPSPAIEIVDSNDETLHTDTPVIDGRFARAPFPELEDGEYSILWSVVSSDGHRIEGTIEIEVTAGLTLAGPDEPATPDDVDESPSEAPAEVSPEAPAEATTESAPAEDDDATGLSTPLKILVGVGGAAAFALVAILAIRRRKNFEQDGRDQ